MSSGTAGRRWGRARGAALLALLGAGTAPVLAIQEPEDPQELQESQDPVAAAPASATPEDAAPVVRYHTLEDRDALLSAWLGSGLVERVELENSVGGRELFAVQFGRQGPAPLAERTTLFLLGGLDGVSFCGSEAVVAVTGALLANPEALPENVAFVAIPWANPDGLARSRTRGCGRGTNDQPLDEDADGRVDEDGPDDLDGDGLVLEMLVEDPDGPWVRSEDERFLRPAREGEAPRYRRVREGLDEDGDGRFNEDGAGGVALDHNFPVGWQGPWSGVPSGAWPLSEPESEALAELARTRQTALVIVFQGNHGALAAPGGVPRGTEGALELPLDADLPTYAKLVEVFARATGRHQTEIETLSTARGRAHPGAAIDWTYAALGALSMEVAVWGPQVEGGVQETVDAKYVRDEPGVGPENGEHDADDRSAEGATPADVAWARWLDDTRGGIGFVDWQPVEVGEGRRAYVGGWEPETCFNPPAEVLPRALEGLDAFTLELARSLPRISVEVVEARRDERVCLIRARVRNDGALPSGVGPCGERLSTRLALELPPGVSLLAGEERIDLGHLPGQGSSGTYDWLVVAPEDSVFQLTVTSPWSPLVVREVRL